MSPRTAPAVSPADVEYLERARMLGRAGWGMVHPNPMVGCVLVRDGDVVGEGYHAAFGGQHAEVAALEAAGARTRGSTAYVSLEPCNHHGKTPPCTEALLRAGVQRVVYGAREPGAEAGGGAEALRQAGVLVDGPVWSGRAARAENPAFFHTAGHASPFVALKLAMSLDARISAAPGRRTRVSGPGAEREAHRLRTGFDAVMVGAGTLRADDPRLTVRRAAPGRTPPVRMLLVPDAEVPEGAAALQEADSVPLHVFTSRHADDAAVARLERAGAHVHAVAEDRHGLDLQAVLGTAWELGIQSILCEGGARLAASLLREGLARRVYLLIAPVTFGAQGVPAFPDDAGALRWDSFELVLPPEAHGRDTLIVLDRDDVPAHETDDDEPDDDGTDEDEPDADEESHADGARTAQADSAAGAHEPPLRGDA